ncbi:MAG: hypothetical protein F4X11_21115 [Acidobacteria bacterium]|nr:hypothetical protein [Chloroflexota bacterium]MYN67494.1 hypothetical protein [Acidobacteriota bacterium]
MPLCEGAAQPVDYQRSAVFFQTMFREKALARRARRETVDARLQVTAPHEWLLVSGLGVALVVLLAYGLLGRAERSLSIETVLVRPGERIDVVASVSGVVVDVLSEVGDTVTPGQPIARVRTPEAERWGAVLRRLRESMESGDAPQDMAANENLRALLASARSVTAQRGADGFMTEDITTPRRGELVTLALAAGQRIAAGEFAARIRAASARPVEALGFVTREEAMRLVPGMHAQVRLAVPGTGAPQVLPARVEDVSPRVVPPPRWLTEFGLEPPVRSHLLRATLMEPDPLQVIDGASGTLRIVLGHRSFASLLFGSDGD